MSDEIDLDESDIHYEVVEVEYHPPTAIAIHGVVLTHEEQEFVLEAVDYFYTTAGHAPLDSESILRNLIELLHRRPRTYETPTDPL